MNKTCLAIIVLLCVSFGGNAQGGSRKIKVLIVDGFSNHDWRQTTKVTKYILEKSGIFAVSVSTIPGDSIGRTTWHPEFSDYAVVIQNTNNIQDKQQRWPERMERKLEAYVHNGGGLYVLHSANNSFPHWSEYDKMIGLGWRSKNFGYALEIDADRKIFRIPPGEGRSTGHGNRFNAIVEQLTPHPVNRGYPKKWKTADTEVYNYSRGLAEHVTVLSYAYDSTASHKYWPLEWIVKYGKGNVYTSSLGHLWQGETYPVAYRCVGFQTTMIRVVQWLATGKVTYPVPGNFPTAAATSLVAEETIN